MIWDLHPFQLYFIHTMRTEEHEGICVMKRHLGMTRISLSAGFEPETQLSDSVGNAYRLTIQMLPFRSNKRGCTDDAVMLCFVFFAFNRFIFLDEFYGPYKLV